MEAWGLTDVGNVRSQNQDAFRIVELGKDALLAVVCDGMGGAKSGNVASSLAVEVFTDEVRRTQRSSMTPEKAAAMLRSALELANRAVYEQSQLSDDFTGMGTTLVAVWISRDLAVVINVGDSRAYHFTREDVRLITRDHSMVAYMVERGELEPLLKSPSLYKCLSCFACVERCPRGVEPAKLVEALRLCVIRQKGQDRLKPDDIPALLDDEMPQQALMSALRKYAK